MAMQLLTLLCPTRPVHAVGVSRCPWPHPPAEVEEPLRRLFVFSLRSNLKARKGVSLPKQWGRTEPSAHEPLVGDSTGQRQQNHKAL